MANLLSRFYFLSKLTTSLILLFSLLFLGYLFLRAYLVDTNNSGAVFELTKELARAVLPVANYTECIWKIDLHNFFHFVKLRADKHAQREIQDYANAMYELVKPKFPLCCEAFEDYNRDAVTFSKQEMDVIRELLEYTDTKAALAGMSIKAGTLEHKLGKRERTEFLEKLK